MKDQDPETSDQSEVNPTKQQSVLSPLPPPPSIPFNQNPEIKMKKKERKKLAKLLKRYTKALKSIEKIKSAFEEWNAKIAIAQKKDERKDAKHVKSKE